MQRIETALLSTYTLAHRELTRFLRQRNRVVGALAQPLIFWLIFGVGLNASFTPDKAAGVTYVEYFFPGTVMLILLFTAIFATISIIEDRNAGFLQSVLVAPLPASSLVLGKLMGTTVLAVGQAIVLFALAPLAGVDVRLAGFLLALPVLVLTGFGLAGLGFAIAWRMDSTQGFHSVMMALLMPMWFLSGSFFPADGLPTWLWWIVHINPLTYGVAAFRRVLYLHQPAALGDLPSLPLSVGVMVVFALCMLYLSVRLARTRSDGAPI